MNELKQLKDIVMEENIRVHAAEAAIYEIIHPQLFNWYHRRKSWMDIDYINSFLTPGADKHVLDLGCGTGFLTMKVVKWPQAKITAVDLSPEMISELRRKIGANNHGPIHVVNKEALSFLQSTPDRYDVIMASAFLHHIVDLDEFLDSALKVLKPKGILYIAYEPLRQKPDSRLRFLLHRLIRNIDGVTFNLRMRLAGITIDESHESSLADYQTTLGGIDPVSITARLGGQGEILRLDKFATRAAGVLAFISDKIIKSQNTFSIIFRKS